MYTVVNSTVGFSGAAVILSTVTCDAGDSSTGNSCSSESTIRASQPLDNELDGLQLQKYLVLIHQEHH